MKDYRLARVLSRIQLHRRQMLLPSMFFASSMSAFGRNLLLVEYRWANGRYTSPKAVTQVHYGFGTTNLHHNEAPPRIRMVHSLLSRMRETARCQLTLP